MTLQKTFRPRLVAPSHRRLQEGEGGGGGRGGGGYRPLCCFLLTSVVLAFVFAVFVVSGWNLYSYKYDVTSHAYNAGDQVALYGVAKDFSTVFCQAYHVRLERSRGSVYLLTHHAAVNQSQTVTHKLTIDHHQHGHYAIREFYLLAGSRLEVLGCHENDTKPNPTELVLFKGMNHFRKWEHNRKCHDCVFKRAIISNEANCTSTTTTTTDNDDGLATLAESASHHRWHPSSTFNASIADSGQYVLVAVFGRDHDGVITQVTLTRTLFDLRDPRENCTVRGGLHEKGDNSNNNNNNNSNNDSNNNNNDDDHHDDDDDGCEFQLEWDSSLDVVVDFSVARDSRSRFVYSPRRLHTRCRLRLAFWILLFGGVPVVLAVPISFAFFRFLCRKRNGFGGGVGVKRLSSKSEVRVQDDSCLVENEVVPRPEDDSAMAIQDS